MLLSQVGFQYSRAVLNALATHGVQPTGITHPTLVHEFVNDLYRYELRRLRSSYIHGEIPKNNYSSRVIELRKKYLLVSLPLRHWAVQEKASRSV